MRCESRGIGVRTAPVRALALHREALEIFERICDRRERAATLVEVADLLDRKGVADRAAALRAQAERLLANTGR